MQNLWLPPISSLLLPVSAVAVPKPKPNGNLTELLSNALSLDVLLKWTKHVTSEYGHFTHSYTVATGWRWTLVPSCWPLVEHSCTYEVPCRNQGYTTCLSTYVCTSVRTHIELEGSLSRPLAWWFLYFLGRRFRVAHARKRPGIADSYWLVIASFLRVCPCMVIGIARWWVKTQLQSSD
jgi:hypothetical protein